MLKHTFSGIAAILTTTFIAFGQQPGQHWSDVDYAGDKQVFHQMDIHLPSIEKDRYPVVVVIYGSAWFSNNMKQMGFQALGQPLLDRGFAVVSINHRSSADAAYPAQINDVKAAIRYLRANASNYRMDERFIGITGFSSGGHLASLAGTTNGLKTYTLGNTSLDIEGSVGEHPTFSSSVDAVVDWFGPIDLNRMDECKRPKAGNSPESALIRGSLTEHPDLVALASPNTYVDASDVPFLIIHGTADNVVPLCQSELFAAVLQEANCLDAFHQVPDGQHGPVTFNETSFTWMCDFFEKVASKKRNEP